MGRVARAGAVAGVLVLALAGCQTGRADDGGNDGADADAGAGDGGDVPEITGDGSTLVLQVRSGGGFVPWGYDFASVPSLSVYADGTAIVPGPVTLEYPGKALPNLQVVRLPDGALEELVAAAADVDLLAPGPDYGMPNVADLPTTRVRLVVGGETYEHAAYALGAGPGENAPGDEGMFGPGDTGLTDEQSAARQALAQFVQRANELVGATGAEESYQVTALGVLAMAVDPAAQVDAEVIEPAVVPWPVAAVPLADAGECALVEGADAEALLATLADANQLTQFEQDGVVHQVWFRPLLPHETSCADLVG
jgi:hypothetical protein